MEKEEIRKSAEQELQWLRYYATHESRKAFDPAKPPYEQLVNASGPIITARTIPLKMRCTSLKITCVFDIDSNTPIAEMFSADVPCIRENNIFSALEIFMLKYPEERDWVMQSLQ